MYLPSSLPSFHFSSPLLLHSHNNLQQIFVFERGSYVNKGFGYTTFCAQIRYGKEEESEESKELIKYRCVKQDRFAKIITLHYLNSGNITVRLPIRASEYYIPIGLLLKVRCNIFGEL